MLNAYWQTSGKCIPTRATLSATQLAHSADVRSRVLVALREDSQWSPVTVAFDGWTNVRHDKVTNIVAVCSGVAYYWSSIVNSTESNTARWLQQPVSDAITARERHGHLGAAPELGKAC